MNLADKNVIYVGGFGGIGFPCCQYLLEKSIKQLVVLDLKEDPDKLRHLLSVRGRAAGSTVEFVALNLLHGRAAIEATLAAVAQKIGRIDILINGSGIINDHQPKLTLHINLLGLIETVLAAVPLMSSAHNGNGGLIVNIASVLGLEPEATLAVYTASKHGVIGFTRACAHDHYFQQSGIAHIAICPGATATRLLECAQKHGTFEMSKALKEQNGKVKSQTAAECGKSIVKAIEQARNGSIWIADLGKLQQVEMHKYCDFQYEV